MLEVLTARDHPFNPYYDPVAPAAVPDSAPAAAAPDSASQPDPRPGPGTW